MDPSVIKSFLRLLKSKKEKEDSDFLGVCPICGENVLKSQVYKKINLYGEDIYIHKKCFKKMKKEALNMFKK